MSDTNRLNDGDDEEEEENYDEDDEKHWYYPRTSSPHSSLSVNNSFTHQSSSATVGSWGFDVNRSTNGQTPSSLTTNNNNNTDQQIITRTTIKDYSERLVDLPTSSLSIQNSKIRSPTLTKQRDGNEFAAIDRLVHGPNRIPNSSSQQLPINSNNDMKFQAEQELIAWQHRMLQKLDQRIDDSSSKFHTKLNGSNSFHSSSRQTTTANRRIPAMLNKNENQYTEPEHHETTIKSARVIKRYMELVYHLQSFYERITDQLSNGNCYLKTNQSLFVNHCRKIIEQLQTFKPIWDDKLVDLQNQLKDISSFQWSTDIDQITFLKRRVTLIHLLQMLNKEKELNATDRFIRTDIDRVLHEDRLAVQLQDELSTLLQHQSLLNDFTSLLQWNRSVYSSNEQNRVETIFPILREQITTTDTYMTHVSQQLTELVTSLRSSEKYILSYTNTIPLIDDGISSSLQSPSSNDDNWRSYQKNDVSPIKTREHRLQQSRWNEKTNDNSPKFRSTSVPRYMTSGDSIHNVDRDDLRLSINTNNSNNNGISTRFAAVKSAKREIKTQSNVKSILKSYPQIRSSNRKRTDYDVDREMKTNKKEDERKIFSQHNIRDTNRFNPTNDEIRSSFDSKELNKRRQNLHAMFADDTKRKSRYVAAKQYSNKSYQQLLIYPNV